MPPSEEKGSRNAGIYGFQVPVAGLPVGNYIFDIWLDDKQISEIIMVRSF
ncbi:MAG: hypothetical protein LBH32_13950 [Dysgonamonadaceae bacterium]|nr:hypothetical protein [Dysgonamonadaceae bacterium]